MKMTDHETPLQFFYRLNAAAVKGEDKFKSSSKLRESHIRRQPWKATGFRASRTWNEHYVATKTCGVKKDMTLQLLRSPEISVPTTSTKAGLRIVD
ncbi:hypothetical protein PHMEG_00040007 [Phytophthora megakarya]|uniref:Uncharacterized protein n=1 Tax=Phytophthora megakarya TaxID=4795 RepID=A0A225UEQ0_9STRA|nr:hypothetical protein PHMEG_00040007 [Phytophthora megakarya]